jgi:[ribosomal protein S5]-alanine N-acetyltransferase
VHVLLPNILLRKPEPEDAIALYRFRNDPNVVSGLGGFSSGYSMQAIREWIECRNRALDDIVWVIADRESNICLGHVGLYRIDYRVRACEFAILIGESARWGKGTGKEAASGVVSYAFDELNVNRIELTVLASNSRAIRLYQSLGFVQEGIKRQGQFRAGKYVDVILMSLLVGERQC